MAAAFSDAARAFVRALAQLVFADRVVAGMLVLAGIALISPWGAAGAVIGALYGTVVGRVSPIYRRSEWAQGLAGFNPTVVGIVWGGFPAAGSPAPDLLLAALACCTAFEFGLRRLLTPAALPALSMPAVLAIVLTSLIVSEPGIWLWIDAPPPPFGTAGVLVAILCIVAAMTAASAAGAGSAVLLGAATFLSISLLGADPLAFAGLWAITVPLADFAMHGVFLRNSVAGAVAGLFAASLGALIWLLWTASGLADAIPPLLTPFILGVWLSITLTRGARGRPVLLPDFWRAAAAIDRARRQGRSTAALVFAGSDESPVISDFASGAWIGAAVPPGAFSGDRLRASPRCRKAFWTACHRLHAATDATGPATFHRAVAAFQRRGWLHTVISQDVGRRLQRAGADSVVDLYGRIDRIVCTDCGALSEWPPGEIWKHRDLRCADCAGTLMPAITLFGEPPPPQNQARLDRAVSDCGALLVLGEHAVEPSSEGLLQQVRDADGRIVFVTHGAPAYPMCSGDIVVRDTPERTLPALALVLGALCRLPHFRGPKSKARPRLKAAK